MGCKNLYLKEGIAITVALDLAMNITGEPLEWTNISMNTAHTHNRQLYHNSFSPADHGIDGASMIKLNPAALGESEIL